MTNSDGVEIKGTCLDGRDLWLGLSLACRSLEVQDGLDVCSRSWARLRLVQRFVGKMSFAQAFRSCSRSIFDQVYRWCQWVEK